MITFDNALIISDIHLTPAYPYTAKRFVDFCQNEARTAQALFIIGDLFEFWVGDDAHLHSPFHKEIANEIYQVKKSGVAVYFLPGNRDFMLGKAFLKLARWEVLSDPSVVHIGGSDWVLSHGDSLCTADPAYQVFRTITRITFLQKIFMQIPIGYRKKLADKLRRRATIKYQRKQRFDPSVAYIKGDVTLSATADMLTKCKVTQLIHGHTHRPGFHEENFNNFHWKRWVLSDWDFDHPELLPHGSALQINSNGASVLSLV